MKELNVYAKQRIFNKEVGVAIVGNNSRKKLQVRLLARTLAIELFMRMLTRQHQVLFSIFY